MARKKKTADAERDRLAGEPRPHSEAYDAALLGYGKAIELLQKGETAAAIERFEALAAANKDEPELAERNRAFAAICRRKLASEPDAPTDVNGYYHAAVVHTNNRELDVAQSYLTKALELDADSARVLYARASVYALKGQPDFAIPDLKKAIAREPQLRFQASNDTDFERIRDEAGFIDVIEPTPTGA